MKKIISDEQITESYMRLKNVHKCQVELGINHSTIHRKLIKLGIKRNNPKFSDDDKATLLEKYTWYRDRGKLDQLAHEMERTKQFICRKANQIGIKMGFKKLILEPERRKIRSDNRKKSLKVYGHPRGYLGMKHSDESKKKMSLKHKYNWNNMSQEEKINRNIKMMKTKYKNGTLVIPRTRQTWKSAWREIGGNRIYFRSRWEYNYAVYLELLIRQKKIKSWEHEPEIFWFENIKRGTVSYFPDYKVINTDGSVEYHEVKGWMDSRSKTKIKRMSKYYPDVKLIIIDSKKYRELKQKVSWINGWEKD